MRKIFQIAMVEDEVMWSDSLQQMIRKFEQENDVQMDVSLFTSIEAFLTGYKTRYDLVLMDIELPGMNGMDGARKLREIDPAVTLIFVTNMAQFAVQGYEVSALDYLVKPVTYRNFSLKMKRALDVIGKAESKSIVVYGKTEMHSMLVQDILYAEVQGHHLLFHQTDGQCVDACGSLTQLEEKLQGQGFSRCNSCYLLNMKYIDKITTLSVYMTDGTELQISRRRRKDFVNEVALYFGRSGGIGG